MCAFSLLFPVAYAVARAGEHIFPQRQGSGTLTVNPRKLFANKSLPWLFVSKMMEFSKMGQISKMLEIDIA